MPHQISKIGKILLIAFVVVPLLAITLIVVFAQKPTPNQKLIFRGFTNITGNSCAMFEFPASYGPHFWLFFGSMSVLPEVHLQGDKGNDFGNVLDTSPRTNGFLSGSIYSIQVPPGSKAMRVEIEEHVKQSIGPIIAPRSCAAPVTWYAFQPHFRNQQIAILSNGKPHTQTPVIPAPAKTGSSRDNLGPILFTALFRVKHERD